MNPPRRDETTKEIGRPMGNAVELRFNPLGGEPAFQLSAPRLIVAGYTGRDADIVEEHIAELAAIGVPRPSSVPCFFDLDPALATTNAVIGVEGANTTGEVEPVLIRHAGRYHLGVGSDHTDRDLELVDIGGSKAASPKPLGADVLALPAGPSGLDWDGVTIESWVDGTEYQRGWLAGLRTPDDLLVRLEAALGPIESDLVLFCGTVPLLNGTFVAGAEWQISLTTAAGDRLSHSYEVKRRSA